MAGLRGQAAQLPGCDWPGVSSGPIAAAYWPANPRRSPRSCQYPPAWPAYPQPAPCSRRLFSCPRPPLPGYSRETVCLRAQARPGSRGSDRRENSQAAVNAGALNPREKSPPPAVSSPAPNTHPLNPGWYFRPEHAPTPPASLPALSHSQPIPAAQPSASSSRGY